MGDTIFDIFSYLHFASGIIAHFLGLSIKSWTIIHILFEIIENTQYGVFFIDNYLTWWPGGKLKPDAIINRISDVIFGILGWYSVELLQHIIKKI